MDLPSMLGREGNKSNLHKHGVFEKVEAETAAAHGNRRGRNLHRAGGLSR